MLLHVILKFVSLFILKNLSKSKSQDYSRHIELSLLFYWKHDSMADAGKDVGIDLTGGYYDAGDNVKYNFPAASAMTLLAWSGIEFASGYKKAGQFEILLDTVKWGTDYFIKSHPEKEVLYVGVGNGQVDHSFWLAPEFIDYDYPSYKIDSKKPGSEVAGETASALAATSILFKDIDSDYSTLLLKHSIEIYDLADKYRGDYTSAVPSVQGFYSSFSGYLDELAWGAAWLYRAIGEEKYLEKYNTIADAEYAVYDPRKFTECREPISLDDKRSGAYILIAQITKDEKSVKECYDYSDDIISQQNIINYGNHYIFDDKNIVITWDKTTEKINKKAKAKKISNRNKFPIIVISKGNEDGHYLIEIKKNIGIFKEGELYDIKINLLEEVKENLWNKLI